MAKRLGRARQANQDRFRVPHGEAGTTLIELVVGMALLGFFLAMFTGAMYAMSSTTNKVQVVADTSNTATYTFLRLDRQIRYASVISTPTRTSSNGIWHVEFLNTSVVRVTGTNSVSTVNQCTQLAVVPPTSASSTRGAVLEERTWNVNDTAPGGWIVLATRVTNYGATTQTAASPFPPNPKIGSGGASSTMQQLTVNLSLDSAAPATTTTSSTYTLTALNSSTNNPSSSTVCQQFAAGS